MTTSNSSMPDSPASAVLGWVIVMLGLSVAIAGLAFLFQRVGFAPIGLFSLLVGAAVGATALIAGKLFNLKPRRSFLAVTILAVIVTTATEHGFLYLLYRSEFQSAHAQNPQVAFFRGSDPADFGTYLQAEAAKIEPALGQPNWIFWLIDLALGLLAAAGTYLLCQPRPSQESPNSSP